MSEIAISPWSEFDDEPLAFCFVNENDVRCVPWGKDGIAVFYFPDTFWDLFKSLIISEIKDGSKEIAFTKPFTLSKEETEGLVNMAKQMMRQNDFYYQLFVFIQKYHFVDSCLVYSGV